MKKENKRCLLIAICLLAAFLTWTLSALTVDVQAIGPRGPSVGFATRIARCMESRLVRAWHQP